MSRKIAYRAEVDGQVAGTRQSRRVYTHAVVARQPRPGVWQPADAIADAWGVYSFHGTARAAESAREAAGKAYTQVRIVPVSGPAEPPEDSDEPSGYRPEAATLYDGTPGSGSWQRSE